MALEGKGYFIWQVRLAEDGNAEAIAQKAQNQGFTHILVKIADGADPYNIDANTGTDRLPALVTALRGRGIQVWGWHYVYGYNPIGEADQAIQRIQALGLDGYAIDAEAQYKEAGKEQAAIRFMNRLRAQLGGFPIALCSYRYPSYHPRLPWQAFLDQCDLNMPQVYWMQAHNPGEQLIRCVREFQAITPFRPIVPVGAAFYEANWKPTAAEVVEFLQTAQSLNLSAANFWEWNNSQKYVPDAWEAIRTYNWSGGSTPPSDIVQQYIEALNTRNPDRVLSLYNLNAVHVTSERTVHGSDSIRRWYQQTFFSNLLPNASFNLSGYSGSGSARFLTWTATSARGNVRNGTDTFGLASDKIVYHYTRFNVGS